MVQLVVNRMEPERWRLVEELYHAARSLSGDARTRFLVQQCGHDESLRSEVESLLAQPDQTWAPAASAVGVPPAMMLGAGQRIGAYEIVSLLGAGGMGEVYRAHDAKLGRDVAIKILPREWVGDADRMARLGREARVLASLNHPNIATIHGVEDASGMPALVLELVEGETLADRIVAGPIAVPDALTIARQIADALDAAHEKGVVHRDLKPANIKITRAGVVKVLDFGLAKVSGGADRVLSQSPTLTVGGTREGVIAGTAAYMSPEQARGLAVDKRTDIWAFGCVLYEMLVGRPAFSGDTISDVIAAILNREPAFDKLPPSTPVHVVRVMQRCLEKDQRLRWRDIGDVRIELDATRPPPPEAAAATRRSTRLLPWAVATAAIAIALVAFARPFGTAIAPSAAPRLSQAVRLTHTPTQEFGPAIAPDGKWVAYYANTAGRTDVWVKYLDSGTALNLTSSFNLELPSRSGIGGLAISTDGRLIAFSARPDPATPQYDTWTMPAPLGGTPRRLLPGISSVQWSPDGQQLAYTMPGSSRGDTLAVSSTDGTNQRVLVEHEGGRHIHWSAWSHDGRWIYYIHSYDTWHVGQAEIYRVSVNGGTPEPVVRTIRRAIHPLSLPGGLLFAANPTGIDIGLWWRPDSGAPPTPLTNGIGEHVESRLSADGKKVVSTLVDPRDALVAMPVDSASSERRLTTGFDGDIDPALDPVSGRLVFSSTRSGNRNLWIAAADGSGASPLTTEGALDTRPVFSPDGRQIAFVSDRGGERGIWVMNAQGGAPRLLAHENVLDTLTWSKDGTRILFGRPGKDLPGLASVNVADGHVEPVSTPGGAFSPTWSPTADVIAYLEPVTVQLPPPVGTAARMYVRFVDVAGRRLHPALPDTVNFANGSVVWSADGRRLAAFSASANGIAQLWVVEPEGQQPFRKIADLPIGTRPRGMTWTTDNKTIIYGSQESASDIVLYEVQR